MLDRLQEIDTGAIEELARIKRDQEVLEDRLRLMQERREGVSEVVFERVRGDYRKRLEGFETEARPLKERARQEFAKLQSLRRELQQSSDEVRVEKEELEFRHALGEFAVEEYEQRSAASQELLDRREVELGEVEAVAQRFLAAVRSQQELEAEPAAEPLPPGAPAPPLPIAEAVADEAPGASAAGAVVAEALAGEPAAMTAAVAAASAPASGHAPLWVSSEWAQGDSTSVTNDDSSPTVWDEHSARPSAEAQAAAEADFHEAPTGEFDLPPPPPPPAAPTGQHLAGPDDGELSGATRILARPRLTELENGGIGREHALALGRTTIGRASDNLVHLLDEAVSRHHAEIVPGPQGYLLRDLGSENGVYVNGERVPEHVLGEGDVVQIGARTLVFHSA